MASRAVEPSGMETRSRILSGTDTVRRFLCIGEAGPASARPCPAGSLRRSWPRLGGDAAKGKVFMGEVPARPPVRVSVSGPLPVLLGPGAAPHVHAVSTASRGNHEADRRLHASWPLPLAPCH